MTNHSDLLKMFKQVSGTTMYVPKDEPERESIQPWMPSRVTHYFAQSNQMRRGR